MVEQDTERFAAQFVPLPVRIRKFPACVADIVEDAYCRNIGPAEMRIPRMLRYGIPCKIIEMRILPEYLLCPMAEPSVEAGKVFGDIYCLSEPGKLSKELIP